VAPFALLVFSAVVLAALIWSHIALCRDLDALEAKWWSIDPTLPPGDPARESSR
jgi:hypothetical protein